MNYVARKARIYESTSVRSRARSRDWTRSRDLGKRITAAKKWQKKDYPAGFSSQDLFGYYQAKLGEIAIPIKLRADLEWALQRPEVFGPLFQAGVLPLDPKIIAGPRGQIQLLSFAEFLRDHFYRGYDAEKAVVERSFGARQVPGWIDSQIVSYYGPNGPRSFRKATRGIDLEKLMRSRSDLCAVLREFPPDFGAEIGAIQLARRILRSAMDPIDFPFLRPGIFSDVTISGTGNIYPVRTTGYRLLWLKFEDIQQCLDYLLNTGERAAMYWRNPALSLFRGARHMRDYMRCVGPLENGEAPLSEFTMHSTYLAAAKFFVSFSTCHLNYIDDGNPCQVEIKVESARFFRVKSAFYYENEMGLPLVVNPQEIREVTLFLNCKYEPGRPFTGIRRDPGQMVICTLNWDENGTLCAVSIHNTAQDTVEEVFYIFDKKSGRFQPTFSQKTLEKLSA